MDIKTIAASASLAFAVSLGVAHVSTPKMTTETYHNSASVKLMENGKVICTGTHIGSGMILTAKHCITETHPDAEPHQYSVQFNGMTQTIDVKHTNWSWGLYDELDIRILKIEGDTSLPSVPLYCEYVPLGSDIWMQGSPGIPWYTKHDGKMLTAFGKVTDTFFKNSYWAKGLVSYQMPNTGGFSGAGVMYNGGVAFVNSGMWSDTLIGSFSFGAPVTKVCQDLGLSE